ncbi:MAG TPA: hypothetical protein PKC67_00680 [Kiritimatiellia bacterium]|nr:hypothetical protein [Kiritimatiellia bacterium]HMP32835.1 hypothetical protein [Kiritimatiellia bacterium]
MKSAYELAMERLNQQHGKVLALTDAQKKALAEIDRRATAKKAETEILYRDRLAAARARGDHAALVADEEALRAELVRIRDRAEDEREAVRRDPRLA